MPLPQGLTFTNRIGLPDAVLPVVQNFVTVEYATLKRDGTPITSPLTPYVGQDGMTLDVSTGLTYPTKAERARNNPQVCLLYSNPTGSGLENPPCVLIYGHASVRDADLQANTDRYVRETVHRFAHIYRLVPAFILRRFNWYFSRIWVQITPLKALWWEDLNAPPQSWQAPHETPKPFSDPKPAPRRKTYPPAFDTASTWQDGAQTALARLGQNPVLTVTDSDGYPVPFRTVQAQQTPDGFALQLYKGMPATPRGRACLTFHSHTPEFSREENMVFLGSISTDSDRAHFRVTHHLGALNIKGRNRLIAGLRFWWMGMRLRPRLVEEAQRRSQPVPRVRLPDHY